MLQRVQVDAEHRDALDRQPGQAPGHGAVGEQQRVDHQRQRQRGDGEARAAGADRRERHDDAHEGRPHDGHGQRELEGPTVGGDEPGRHPGADPGQRELAQRQLAGVPGDDDDRRDDDAQRERGDQGVGPRVDTDEQAGSHGDADDERQGRHPPAARERQAGQRLAALEAGLAGHHQEPEDDHEGHRLGQAGERGTADPEPVGDVGLEERDLALDDADHQRRGHGDAEGREPTDQGGGERRDHGEGQHRGVERDDGRQEDGGERGERSGDGEVHQLDAIGRPAGAGGDASVLGHRGRRQPEQRPRVHDLEHGGAHEGDPDQQETIEPDRHIAPQRHDPRREHRRRLHDAEPPPQDHEGLAGTEQAEGGDELRQLRRVPDRRDDTEGHEAQQRRRRGARPPTPPHWGRRPGGGRSRRTHRCRRAHPH